VLVASTRSSLFDGRYSALRTATVSRRGAGLTVSRADSVPPPAEAKTWSDTGELTPRVRISNVAVVLPAATLTVDGTLAARRLVLASLTSKPPAGAAWLSFTVPTALPPPRSAPGFTFSDVSRARVGVGVGGGVVVPPGSSHSTGALESSPSFISTHTGVERVTALVVTGKVTLLCPAGTVTVAGA
jgi:hypothetical protein